MTITCVVCRASGVDAFTSSDDGYYVCARCGTQSQHTADDFNATLDISQDGEGLPGASIGAGGLRRRVLKAQTKEKVVKSKKKDERVKDAKASCEAYVASAQALLIAQCDALSRMPGCVRSGEMFEVTVREIWFRYIDASGVLRVDFEDERETWRRRPTKALHVKDDNVGKGGAEDGDDMSDDDDDSDDNDSDDDGYGDGNDGVCRRRRRRRRMRQKAMSTLAYLTQHVPMYATLSVLYVAAARHREAILPFDLAKMALDGTLPYLNVYEVIKSALGESVVDALPRADCFVPHERRIPTPMIVVSMAAYVAAKIKVELPPVNAPALLSRYVQMLNLDEAVDAAAQRMLSLYLPPTLRYFHSSDSRCAYTPESTLMALLVLTLKLLYGLDGRSSTAERTLERVKVNKNGVGRTSMRTLLAAPHCKPVANTGWTTWAQATSKLGKLTYPWTTEDALALSGEEKDAYIQWCNQIVFAGRTLPFPFDRFAEKLLNQVPNARKRGSMTLRAAPRPPRPFQALEDPVYSRLKAKCELMNMFESRIVEATALVILKARTPSDSYENHFFAFKKTKEEMIEAVIDRVKLIATLEMKREFVAHRVEKKMREMRFQSNEMLLSLVGEVVDRTKADVNYLSRVLFATGSGGPNKAKRVEVYPKTKMLVRDFALEQKKSIGKSFAGDKERAKLLEIVDEVLQDLLREQRTLDVLLKHEPEWQGFEVDETVEDLSAQLEKLSVQRDAGTFLQCARDKPIAQLPEEYVEIVHALSHAVWIEPDSLHENVLELELLMLKIEENISTEIASRLHEGKKKRKTSLVERT